MGNIGGIICSTMIGNYSSISNVHNHSIVQTLLSDLHSIFWLLVLFVSVPGALSSFSRTVLCNSVMRDATSSQVQDLGNHSLLCHCSITVPWIFWLVCARNVFSDASYAAFWTVSFVRKVARKSFRMLHDCFVHVSLSGVRGHVILRNHTNDQRESRLSVML